MYKTIYILSPEEISINVKTEFKQTSFSFRMKLSVKADLKWLTKLNQFWIKVQMNTYSKIKLFEIHIIFRYESHVKLHKFWTNQKNQKKFTF